MGFGALMKQVLTKEAFAFFKRLFQTNDQCLPHTFSLTNIPQISGDLHEGLLWKMLNKLFSP